jgi:GWxTD domain-containing protein
MVIRPEDISSIDPNNFASQYNKETVTEHIRSLAPISSEAELNFASNVILSDDAGRMQQYLVYFWQKRNPEEPEKAWLAYAEQVKKVNSSYSTNFNKGYATDRGRVYLKYGPPNTINANQNDPNVYPYEIWHYYRVNNQSNRKFVFYNPAGASDEYELLHSDAIGELNDYRWKYKLLSRDIRSQPGNNLDLTNPDPYYSDKINKDFE